MRFLCCCSVTRSRWCFVTPWTTAYQLSKSFIISQSLLKFKAIETVMPSNHLILVAPFSSSPQSFPASGSFPMNQFFTSGGQSIGVLSSASVLPMNIQDWFPLEWTGLMSLQSKGLSRIFSNTTPQSRSISSSALSLLYGPTLTFIHDYWKDHSFDYMTFVGRVMSVFLICSLGWS